jgi:hypothetical protein
MDQELASRTEKAPWFEWIRKTAKGRFGAVHSKGRNNDDCYALSRSELRVPYVLRIWGGGWFGLSLEPEKGSGFPPIQFNFHNTLEEGEAGNTAARLFQDEFGTFLIHDGRTSTRGSRPRPGWDESVNLGSKRYYLVGQIGADDFFERLILFNETRSKAFEVSRDRQNEKVGADRGPKRRFTRVGSDASPIHGYVVEELVAQLESFKFRHKPHPHRGPDVVMTRGGDTFLFEVKPSHNFHDFVCALGQLIVYGHETKADFTFCVCPKGAWPSARLEPLFKAKRVRILEFTIKGGRRPRIDFPELGALITSCTNSN